MLLERVFERAKGLSDVRRGRSHVTTAPVVPGSGRRDLNPRPQRPERCALPNCATSRRERTVYPLLIGVQSVPSKGRLRKETSMRIAEVAPPWLAVPPRGYGGIEWVVAMTADGLVERGHEVTLFATGDSSSKAHLEYLFEHAPGPAEINSQWLDTAPSLLAF